MAFSAGLMMTKRKISQGLRLSALPASICPLGIDSMPARMISVAYAPRFTTIATSAAVCGDQRSPMAGSAKKKKNNCTRNGVLRITSI